MSPLNCATPWSEIFDNTMGYEITLEETTDFCSFLETHFINSELRWMHLFINSGSSTHTSWLQIDFICIAALMLLMVNSIFRPTYEMECVKWDMNFTFKKYHVHTI